MSENEKINALDKTIDALYKKSVILLAAAGGFGAYAVKFLEQGSEVGYLFAVVFVILSAGIISNYDRLNQKTKELERMSNE